MTKNYIHSLKTILLILLFVRTGDVSAIIGMDPVIVKKNNPDCIYNSVDRPGGDEPLKSMNNQNRNVQGQTFIINTCITDLIQFKELVKAASRLKKFGTVRINVSTLADKGFHEIPEGGNPWNEYASNLGALYKFFPDPKIAPFIPADFVLKNRKLLLDKTKILRENGMEAAFFANEPAFLPSAFFDSYPQLRGPRVDHPRRSNFPCFAPCLSVLETENIYSNMMSEMLKNAPEVKTIYFKTNDAGSGNCWSDWLYTGPNGPGHCKGETTGERISELMSAFQAGAAKAGSKLDVYLSYSQGSSNFSDEERTDIESRLPENCYFKSNPDNKMISIGSDIGFLYPVKGICNVLSVLDDLHKIDKKSSQTIFISFSSFYDRGYESFKVEDLILRMLEDHLLDSAVNDEPILQKLHKYSVGWTDDKNGDNLYNALIELDEAFNYKNSNLRKLYGIYWAVSSRMINRPLVVAPQRLSKQEESYFLPYIFNVSEEEARMDYLDIHGGRWTTLPDSVRIYVGKIRDVCLKLEAIPASAPKYDFLREMALALRVHASLMQSCGNFTEAQEIRDRNSTKLNGPVHRPDKESNWTGDPDLQKFNTIMRDELDNTVELESILKRGGINVLCLAKDNAHEDCFLLNPDIIGQLKKKRMIMIDHWRDIEDYLTSPFK
ncbi:MAG: hypothetical protein IPN67_06890 [Bacteroidales bacterium]|nr:hypothetical protein [Bacteroidales bacterium]